MLVLLTGGTGFIGPATARALAADGHRLRALVRKSSDRAGLTQTGLPIEFVVGDVGSPDSLAVALDGVEAVVHLAGATKALRVDEYYRINADGTRALAEAAIAAGTRRFVLCSTLSAAGPISGSRPVREEDPPAPVSHYGRSKLAGEEALRHLAGQIAVTIVRPPIVYGPRDKDVFQAFQMVSRGLAFSPGILGRKRYSMIHVEDLGQALARALAHGKSLAEGAHDAQGLYYASDGGIYTWDDLLRRIARALGKNALVIPVPQTLSWGAGIVGEVMGRISGKAQIVSLDKIREIMEDGWACTTERARRELGYEPRFSLDEGIADAVRWYRENRWL